MSSINLPHAGLAHRVTLKHHPESKLWTPGDGVEVAVYVYGKYSRKTGQSIWTTDLVQPVKLDSPLTQDMKPIEMKSLADALAYNLQWQVSHGSFRSRGGFVDVNPATLTIRRIADDVISRGA